MRGNSLKMSIKKRVANFGRKGIKDLWILENGNVLSAEVWESKGSICNHPIEGIKGRALKDSRREHFLEAELVENSGGTWEIGWGRAGIGQSSEW